MKIPPLSDEERKVYLVIREIIGSHRQLTKSEIFPLVYAELATSMGEEAVLQAINALNEKRYFLEGCRLTRDEVLRNAVRKRIFGFIQKNPGTYNRQIRRECNVGSNEFKWHLGMLLKFGFVKKEKFEGRSYGYFENRWFGNHEYDLFLMQNEKVAAIIAHLENNPDTISGIARSLGIHYNTVQKYIAAMEGRDFFVLQPETSPPVYQLNRDLQVKLQKIINGQLFIEEAEAYHPAG